MRINLGIRRRLAPLMDNNRPKIELLNSLLMSVIGSPVLYYGDEIGMGDNIFLGDRNGVRTPMQWSPDRNAGFSRADPQRLYLPPIMDPVYGYAAVNVEAQSRSTASLLNWTKRLIAARKAHPALSRGSTRFLRPGNRKVIAYLRQHEDQVLLCVANLARSSQPVELDLREFKGRIPIEVLGQTPFPPIGELPYLLTLPPWGFYWFSLSTDADYPKWHVERPVNFEFPVLVIPEGLMAALAQRDENASDLSALLARRVREQLENEVLPQILPQQRWFGGKGRTMRKAMLLERGEWATPLGNWLLALVEVDFEDGSVQTYSAPLALAWEQGDGSAIEALRHCTLARVRQRARVGVLYDAFWDDAFCRASVLAMQDNLVRPMPGGELRWRSTGQLAGIDVASLAVKHPSFEQSNTLVILGERVVLKGYRRLRPGINPEIEIGRFLTEVSSFSNIAALLGSLEHVSADGERTAIAVAHAYVSNEGSGWDYTVAHVKRLVDEALARPTEVTDALAAPDQVSAPLDSNLLRGGFRSLMETLGMRTAQLHSALAKQSGDPAFDPEPFSEEDVAALRKKLQHEAQTTIEVVASRLDTLPGGVRENAQRLLDMAQALQGHASAIVPDTIDAAKTRYHGDFHLGQVLISKHDFVIVDFEGEPSRPLEERRAKHSPLRDVAGMLRSFGYAAAVAARQGLRTPEEREHAAAALAQWRRDTSDAFIAGYKGAIDGAVSYPRSEETFTRLVAAFTLEKALYELRYELANRPDWVDIPLGAILELVTGA
jgi:maltose alpha-D-glucosyltransferase/alpha-amylase